ncbi:TonB-dependent receptor [Terriglobus albidus]|uniref:TonB-dependent receptor n=1 Tax=Terriglobus albidus TaxID=1592106 RepID=A0A5B9E8Y5_9BACT|nr:TonB-dependent receptor [Terriglobus albidus]QEE26727.1 TonB-dependent receptor [Terriglobus albidus]
MRPLSGTKVFSCLLLLSSAAMLAAQSTLGDIAGTVHDATGADIANASVTLVNTDSGIKSSQTSSGDGSYRFQQVAPGHYRLEITAAGFSKTGISNLTVNLDAHLTQDVTLSVGSTGEVVEVNGYSPQINTESNSVGGVVTQDEIDKLPVNTRQYLNLALLVPGTSQDASRSFYNNVQIGGGSGYYTNGFVIDGVSNVFAEMGEPRQNFPQGGVQEFKVNITQYPAEYGLSMGGLISVVTKSGTNAFHGEAFELWRNKAINAPKFNQTVNPEFNRNQFGGDIGGPILKDRTHFYLAFERTQTSEVYTVAANPSYYSANNGAFSKPSHDQMFTARVDHKLTDKQALFARYAQEWNLLSYQGCGGATVRNCYNGEIPRQSLVVGHTYTLSPRLLNDLRFQYAYASYQLGPPNAPIPTNPGSYSQQVLNSLQTAYTFPGFSYGFGYADTGVERRFQLLDSVSYVLGKHTFKAGFDVSYIPFTDGAASNYNGTWTFGTDQVFDPNNASTIAALKNPTSYTQTIPFISTKIPTAPLGLYGEDEWKVSRNLTVNLGLRWERQFGSFNERLNYTTAQSQIPFINNNKARGDSNNFAPRIGLVWDITGKSRDVIRAGYGIYYNNIQTLQNFSEARNLVSCSISIVSPSYPNPFGAGKTAADYCSTNKPTVTFMAPNFQNPYAQQYSAGYSRQISNNLSVNLDGLYSYSLHDYRTIDLNYPTSGTTRPATGWNIIYMRAPIAASKYKALFVRVDKRLSRRHMYTVSYTLQSTRDNNPQATATNPLNLGLDWGPGNADRRHALVASFGYQLPWGIVSSGILTLRSATPFSAYAATVNADSITQYVPGTTRNQVNRDVDFSLINTYRASRGLAAVDPSTVQNSAYKSFDLRLLKNFRIHDRFSLEVYGQAFNLFGANNYLYNSITTSAASATFGRATDSGNRQQGELAARFTF